MLNSGRVRTVTLPLRKIGAALPTVALLSVGVLLSASAAPTPSPDFAASDSAPVVVVPDVALTQRATPGLADALGLQPPPALVANGGAPGVVNTLVPLLPPGTDPDSSTPVTLDTTGIPVRALEAYRLAATLTDSADPGCHIDWALVAAIGRVESNHARFGGNQLDSGGVAQPGIIGIPLDGTNGTARITDTDGGQWDRDTTYDRAVGPMQFIPGTWRSTGVDADGDGAKNPQDMADAATATSIYLCSGPGDLSTAGDLRSSILRYNYSDSYVRMVTSIAAAYRNGVSALPASDLAPAASPTIAASTTPAVADNTNSPAPSPAPSSPEAVHPSNPTQAGSSTSPAPAGTTTTTPAPAPATTTHGQGSTTTTPAPTGTTTTSSPSGTSSTTTTSSPSGTSSTTTTTTPSGTTSTTTTTTPSGTTSTTSTTTTTPATTTPATTTPATSTPPTSTPPAATPALPICQPTATAAADSTVPATTPAPCAPPEPCLTTTAADVLCTNPDGSVRPTTP